MRRRALPLLLAAGFAVWTLVPARAEGVQLQAYQMVRSLQLVQDRIAGGDHATLPMQKKLLELVDERFRHSTPGDFADRRNFDALLIYAMSGGNPATVIDTLARHQFPEQERLLGTAVTSYLTGNMAQAKTAMADVDPRDFSAEVGGFLALIKGSVTALEDSRAGMAILDQARLLAPGTLVEEAALRRTVSLAVSEGELERFLTTSEQYARRYLRSPYASQFAEAFVSGLIALKDQELDLARVDGTIAWMTREQAKTIYLRLARRAAIDGDTALLEHASKRAREIDDPMPAVSGARGELYSSISSVTSETVQNVLERLNEFDPTPLSASDRALLDAARAVAAEVVAPVNAPPPERAVSDEADENLVNEPLVVMDETPEAVTQEAAEPPSNGMEATDAIVTSARSKLEAIDRMLEEAEQ